MTTRRHLTAGLVLAIGVGLAVVAAVRSGKPRRVAEVRGEVISPPVGTGGWVAWIESDEENCRLVAARCRGGRGRVVLTAPALAGLAVSGEVAFFTQTEGSESALVRMELPAGAVEQIATLHGPAAQMVAGEEWLCWREHRGPGLPGVPFVVAGAPINVIRASRAKGGEVSLVAPVTGSVDLVGVGGDDLYWVERHGEGAGAVSAVRQARLPHGKPETLVTEEGWRIAALTADRAGGGGDELVWTAPSVEGAEPAQFCAVKRRPLSGGETGVIGDWMDPVAALLSSTRGLFVQDRYHLWRLGRQRSDQRTVYPVPPALMSSSLVGDEQYLVLGSPDRQVVAVRPLGFWGRLRQGLQP